MEKIIAFDYMLSLFEKWHNEVAKKGEKFESLSKLSVLKLLFLVSVPKNDTDDEDLLQIFNKFCALPYGPVESEIYTAINSNLLPSYSITERSIKKKADNVKNMSDIGTYALIDKAVEKLKSTNSNLILTNAFDLVEITHQWESWKSAYNFAKFMGMQSYEMTITSIKEDTNKYFGN